MTPRSRRVAIGLGGLTVLLFAGRWSAEFLAERWWVVAVSPGAAVFSTRWALLKVGLEVGAIAFAFGWFALHFLLAVRLRSRALEGIPRPESGALSLRPTVLAWWALGSALLLAILCGAGTGSATPAVMLALEQPRWGLSGAGGARDAGFYLATLPVLLQLQQFALGLALIGFIATTMLYAISGALRVAARQFVFDAAIRVHLGTLGAVLGVTLSVGYLLEPWQLEAGLRPAIGAAHLLLLSSMARVLAGFALAAAVLTMLWGLRGRMMVPVGAWASLALFALAIRLLAPAAGSASDADRPDDEVREREREAFSIPPIVEATRPVGFEQPVIAALPVLWTAHNVVADSGRWLGADRLTTSPGATREPILLLVAPVRGSSGVAAYAVAEREATATGGPLSHGEGAAGPAPGVVPFRRWPDATVYPGNHGVRVAPDAPGVPTGGVLRRLALSWALQVNLFGTGSDHRVAWRSSPGERLAALAPFASWGAPKPRIQDGGLVWVLDGYLFATSFPGVRPVPWRGRPVSYLRAGLLGVVDAETGRARIFLRGDQDPLVMAWGHAARGMVEPWESVPERLADQLHYPGELFAVQGRVLQRAHWEIGLANPVGTDSLDAGPRRTAYLAQEGGPVAALLEADFRDQRDQLRLVRLDSLARLENPRLLGERWERLPFVSQMADSVRAAGARLELGRVRLEPTAEGLVAFQTGHAVDSLGRATLVLVNLALGNRLGTGPRADAAWRNLRGEEAALPLSVGPAGQLREARTWLLRADSAFRRGDLAGFGRAFDALRAILEYPPGPAK